MRHKIILNFDFKDKLFDKKIHEQLVYAVQHVGGFVNDTVHVWQNYIWVADETDLLTAMTFGAELQKQFPKKALSFAMYSTGATYVENIRALCRNEARKLYDEYVSRSQTTLFGSEGLASFESLPEFFTQGTTITI